MFWLTLFLLFSIDCVWEVTILWGHVYIRYQGGFIAFRFFFSLYGMSSSWSQKCHSAALRQADHCVNYLKSFARFRFWNWLPEQVHLKSASMLKLGVMLNHFKQYEMYTFLFYRGGLGFFFSLIWLCQMGNLLMLFAPVCVYTSATSAQFCPNDIESVFLTT